LFLCPVAVPLYALVTEDDRIEHVRILWLHKGHNCCYLAAGFGIVSLCFWLIRFMNNLFSYKQTWIQNVRLPSFIKCRAWPSTMCRCLP
jgi:hypothetical protein